MRSAVSSALDGARNLVPLGEKANQRAQRAAVSAIEAENLLVGGDRFAKKSPLSKIRREVDEQLDSPARLQVGTHQEILMNPDGASDFSAQPKESGQRLVRRDRVGVESYDIAQLALRSVEIAIECGE